MRLLHIPENKLKSILERCVQRNDCLEWTGDVFFCPRKNKTTYPKIVFKCKRWRGNRLVWTLVNGDIPSGKFIMHTCDNIICLNPKHLIAGSPKDNVTDMIIKGRGINQKKTHCKNGHEYDELAKRPGGKVARVCKTCRRAYARVYDTRRRAIKRKASLDQIREVGE